MPAMVTETESYQYHKLFALVALEIGYMEIGIVWRCKRVKELALRSLESYTRILCGVKRRRRRDWFLL